MTDVHIRKAQSTDLVQMQEIARRTIDCCYRSFLGDEAVESFLASGASDKELDTNLSNCDVLERGGVIVALSIDFDSLVHLMMVDVSLQREGIGAQLLAHSENQLIAAGHAVIRLETFEGNQQAMSFYLKNGWSVVRREKDPDYGFVRVFFEKVAKSISKS